MLKDRQGRAGYGAGAMVAYSIQQTNQTANQFISWENAFSQPFVIYYYTRMGTDAISRCSIYFVHLFK